MSTIVFFLQRWGRYSIAQLHMDRTLLFFLQIMSFADTALSTYLLVYFVNVEMTKHRPHLRLYHTVDSCYIHYCI